MDLDPGAVPLDQDPPPRHHELHRSYRLDQSGHGEFGEAGGCLHLRILDPRAVRVHRTEHLFDDPPHAVPGDNLAGLARRRGLMRRQQPPVDRLSPFGGSISLTSITRSGTAPAWSLSRELTGRFSAAGPGRSQRRWRFQFFQTGTDRRPRHAGRLRHGAHATPSQGAVFNRGPKTQCGFVQPSGQSAALVFHHSHITHTRRVREVPVNVQVVFAGILSYPASCPTDGIRLTFGRPNPVRIA